MAKNQTRKIRPADLQNDLEAFAALQAINEYRPANEAFTLSALTQAKAEMEARQTAEIQKAAEAKAARDQSVAAEWEFHNLILGAKTQVKAQFGADSNELSSLGLKKASEYGNSRRSPTRRETPNS
jgi:hypothetical protein